MEIIIKILNDNQGVISAVGLFLVVPLSLLTGLIIDSVSKDNNRKKLAEILIDELWFNLNYVSQINNSYERNLHDTNGVHLPHYPPRTAIIEKIIEFNLIKPLSYSRKLLEVYAQLSEAKIEFSKWVSYLNANANDILTNKNVYKTKSTTLQTYIEPLMKNMIDLWLQLLLNQDNKELNENFVAIKQEFQEKLKKNKQIRVCYKTSELKVSEKAFVYICWINDSKKSLPDIIELKDKAALFDTWKD
ncbi:MAG: hypothetical protein H0W89_03580 [Candidatus Levybacteria bacterium]|nr:hypothetical protein [Candidatus Levybacteria bacterium]